MRRINQCLNAQLSTICQKTIQLEMLNQKINRYLPETLQGHCQVASFNQGKMMLVLDEVSLATELHYFLPTLRDALRTQGGLHQLASVNINSRAGAVATVIRPKKRLEAINLSSKARVVIEQASIDCDYEPLKNAWRRLGRIVE